MENNESTIKAIFICLDEWVRKERGQAQIKINDRISLMMESRSFGKLELLEDLEFFLSNLRNGRA